VSGFSKYPTSEEDVKSGTSPLETVLLGTAGEPDDASFGVDDDSPALGDVPSAVGDEPSSVDDEELPSAGDEPPAESSVLDDASVCDASALSVVAEGSTVVVGGHMKQSSIVQDPSSVPQMPVVLRNISPPAQGTGVPIATPLTQIWKIEQSVESGTPPVMPSQLKVLAAGSQRSKHSSVS